MKLRKAYQTLENRNNPDKIEEQGPFLCSHKNAWLGKGYYFWDSFIENAHWWGQKGVRYKNGYVICESTFELDEDKCFNLIDNPEHLTSFKFVKSALQTKQIHDKPVVSRIIEFLKQQKNFKYEAIRANGINSRNDDRTLFMANGYQYLESSPAIQICFLTKNALNRKGFKIVYPEEYAEGFVV
jgi:hypothetical protein